jgi:hypothetical protein
MPYLNIPRYDKDFVPAPEREWEKLDDNRFECQAGKGTLSVFRFDENKPWWAECDSPEIESTTWFWTAEQAQYWIEQEIADYFNITSEIGNSMTEEQLAAIEARVNAATSGPWVMRVQQDSRIPQVGVVAEHTNEDIAYNIFRAEHLCQGQHNMAFISYARTDIPELIAEVRRLQNIIKESEDISTIAYLSGFHEGRQEQEKAGEDDLK